MLRASRRKFPSRSSVSGDGNYNNYGFYDSNYTDRFTVMLLLTAIDVSSWMCGKRKISREYL